MSVVIFDKSLCFGEGCFVLLWWIVYWLSICCFNYGVWDRYSIGWFGFVFLGILLLLRFLSVKSMLLWIG